MLLSEEVTKTIEDISAHLFDEFKIKIKQYLEGVLNLQGVIDKDELFSILVNVPINILCNSIYNYIQTLESLSGAGVDKEHFSRELKRISARIEQALVGIIEEN